MLTEDCPVIDDTRVRSMAHLLISLSPADPLTAVDVRQPYIYPVILFIRAIDSTHSATQPRGEAGDQQTQLEVNHVNHAHLQISQRLL